MYTVKSVLARQQENLKFSHGFPNVTDQHATTRPAGPDSQFWTRQMTLGLFWNHEKDAEKSGVEFASCQSQCETKFWSKMAPGENSNFRAKSNVVADAASKRGSKSTSSDSLSRSPPTEILPFFDNAADDDSSSLGDKWPSVPSSLDKISSSSSSASSTTLSSSTESVANLSPPPLLRFSTSRCDDGLPRTDDDVWWSASASGCSPATIASFTSDSSGFALLDAVEETHQAAQIIRKDRIFVMPSLIRCLVEESVRNGLGACVSYVGACANKRCAFTLGSQCFRCDNQLRVHMYACSCSGWSQNGDGGEGAVAAAKWCPHIHAATLRGRVLFGHEAVVFVHESADAMHLRHLRSICYGIEVSQPKLDEYRRTVEQFEQQQGESGMRQYQPQLTDVGRGFCACACPPYRRCRKCAVCYCSFVCECEEYRLLGYTCEHLHVAAASKQYQHLFENHLRLAEIAASGNFYGCRMRPADSISSTCSSSGQEFYSANQDDRETSKIISEFEKQTAEGCLLGVEQNIWSWLNNAEDISSDSTSVSSSEGSFNKLGKVAGEGLIADQRGTGGAYTPNNYKRSTFRKPNPRKSIYTLENASSPISSASDNFPFFSRFSGWI